MSTKMKTLTPDLDQDVAELEKNFIMFKQAVVAGDEDAAEHALALRDAIIERDPQAFAIVAARHLGEPDGSDAPDMARD